MENELFIDDIKIEMKTHTKLLGVLVDQHLTFEEHCKFIKRKIARGIGIYKGKKYLNQKSLLNRYYAFIYPYFTHCITVWGNTFSYILDPLMKLQKRALRLVDGAGKYDHTAPIFEKYELLNLRNLYIYCAQIFLYKHHQEILPEVFSHFFPNEQCCPWALYNTRKTFPCASLQISAEVKMFEMLWCENLQLYDWTHGLQLFFCIV